jgi:hypothetical protein
VKAAFVAWNAADMDAFRALEFFWDHAEALETLGLGE